MKISKANAPHYVWGEKCDGWRLVQQPHLSVIHERMPGGTAEVKHYHERAEQFFFILSGTAAMEIAGETVELYAQEGVSILPGVPHRMYNPTEQDVEFMVISSPASSGDRVLAD